VEQVVLIKYWLLNLDSYLKLQVNQTYSKLPGNKTTFRSFKNAKFDIKCKNLYNKDNIKALNLTYNLLVVFSDL